MRILKIDRRNSFLHLLPQNSDDFWHLQRVIEKHDLVSGSADRRIKPHTEGEKAERVKISVTVDVESVLFHGFSGNLRVSGAITAGKPGNLVELGAMQSIEIAPGDAIKIQKKELLQHQVDRIEKAAAESKRGKVLLAVMDDEQADIALLGEFQLQEKCTVRSGKSGKQFAGDEGAQKKYFGDVFAKIKDAGCARVVIAGPGFAKESMKRFIEEKGGAGKMQFSFAATNSVGHTGLQELLKGNALEKIVQEMQLVKETQIVEKLLAELGKNTGLAEYGLQQVQKAVEFGAVETLLVADKAMLEQREAFEQAMKKAEQAGSIVHIINSESEAGEKLLGLGGIAGLLRYRIE